MSLFNIILAGGGVALLVQSHKEFMTEASPFRATIKEAAESRNISENILASLLWQESHFNPAAVGSVGEIGISQFRQIALDDIVQNGFSMASDVSELSDPENGIHAAAWLLRLNRARLGSIYDSIRAYNSGVGNAKNNPGASNSYATDVMKNAAIDYAFTIFDKG